MIYKDVMEIILRAYFINKKIVVPCTLTIAQQHGLFNPFQPPKEQILSLALTIIPQIFVPHPREGTNYRISGIMHLQLRYIF